MKLSCIFESKQPVICSPGINGPADLVLDLGKANEVIISWQIRLNEFVPETRICATSVLRKHEYERRDYKCFFSFPDEIIIPQKENSFSSGKVISESNFPLTLFVVPPLGIYFMHFLANYESEKMSGTYSFYQKLQIVRRTTSNASQ